MNNKHISRRRFMTGAAAFSGGMLMPGLAQAASGFLTGFRERANTSPRVLSFYNTHTGERSRDIVYWDNGYYVPDAMQEINHVLRDWRTNEVTRMDPALMDQLYALREIFAADGFQAKDFNIISGYRSPRTNAMLRKASTGVAKKSLHMEGKAIDINLPGVNLKDLRKAALGLKSGGVGYYPSSGFVHVDTGRVRSWG